MPQLSIAPADMAAKAGDAAALLERDDGGAHRLADLLVFDEVLDLLERDPPQCSSSSPYASRNNVIGCDGRRPSTASSCSAESVQSVA